MLVFLVGVVTGLLVAFVVAYCLGHDIHRRLHEAHWFGPDEPFRVHTHWDDAATRTTPEDLAAEQAKPKAESLPVTDADLAVAYDTLLTGQKPRLPQREPVAPELPAEPAGPLTYAQVVAMQGEKPVGEVQEVMIDRAREIAKHQPLRVDVLLRPIVQADEMTGCKALRVNRVLPELVWTKGETRMGCTVRETDAAAQLKAALAFEEA